MASSSTRRSATARPARRPAAKTARPRAAHAKRRAPARMPSKAPVQIKFGRLGVLVLVLIAGALYVSPLRAFFAQQNRYSREVAVLAKARSDNAALKAQVAKVATKQYILEQAREDFQLVPAGMQAFVVTGLPAEQQPVMPDAPPQHESLSLPQRLVDLWRTLLH